VSQAYQPGSSQTRKVALLGLSLALVSCTTNLSSDRSSEPGAGAPTPTTPAPGDPSVPGTQVGPGSSTCNTLLQVPRRIWRLSNAQVSNSIRDVLGAQAGPAISGGGATEHGFIQNALERVDDALVFSYWQAATQVAPSSAGRAEWVGCQGGEAEAACAQRFAERLAARGFRRPVSGPEIAGLMQVFEVGRQHSFTRGIELLVEAVVQAPSFVYRTELGAGTGPEPTQLSAFEVASQLSYLLLDSAPDAALFQAAESGKLATLAGVAEELERLLRLPEVERNLTRVVVSWFGTSRVSSAAKDPELFPEWDPSLRSDLEASVNRFIEDTLWGGNYPLEELLGSQRVFVNARLGEFLGLSGATGDTLVPLIFPEREKRSGLLTHPAMLAAVSNVGKTSVVHRGMYARKEFLCADPVPSPPPGVLDDPSLQQALSMLPTERLAAEYRLQNSGCAGCHSLIDSYGLLLENFDPVGRYRDSADGVPVDARATLSVSPALMGVVDGARAFAEGLEQDGVFSACAVRKFASYALGMGLQSGSICELSSIRQRFDTGDHGLRSLLRELVLSDFMRTRGGS
jgi:hypothetical protein